MLWRKQVLEDALEDRPSRKERGSKSQRRAWARCFPEACLTWGRCACLLNSAYGTTTLASPGVCVCVHRMKAPKTTLFFLLEILTSTV